MKNFAEVEAINLLNLFMEHTKKKNLLQTKKRNNVKHACISFQRLSPAELKY